MVSRAGAGAKAGAGARAGTGARAGAGSRKKVWEPGLPQNRTAPRPYSPQCSLRVGR